MDEVHLTLPAREREATPMHRNTDRGGGDKRIRQTWGTDNKQREKRGCHDVNHDITDNVLTLLSIVDKWFK